MKIHDLVRQTARESSRARKARLAYAHNPRNYDLSAASRLRNVARGRNQLSAVPRSDSFRLDLSNVTFLPKAGHI
jgi:hypothetical protein